MKHRYTIDIERHPRIPGDPGTIEIPATPGVQETYTLTLTREGRKLEESHGTWGGEWNERKIGHALAAAMTAIETCEMSEEE